MKQLNLPFALLILTILGCSKTQEGDDNAAFNHVADENVQRILMKAITYAGGMNAWQELKTIAYQKDGILFEADGTIESATSQYHVYEMTPAFSAQISWQKDSSDHLLEYSPKGIYKYVNETQVVGDEQALQGSVMSALFVLGMPFKLLDPGVMLYYQGKVMFKDSVEAEVIQAVYEDAASYADRTSNELWWFYFDPETGKFLGSKVYHAPTYALIENSSFAEDLPIQFPAYRKSYRVDSLGKIQYLRAVFRYSAYSLN